MPQQNSNDKFDITADPEFRRLDRSARHNILMQADPEYKALDAAGQKRVQDVIENTEVSSTGIVGPKGSLAPRSSVASGFRESARNFAQGIGSLLAPPESAEQTYPEAVAKRLGTGLYQGAKGALAKGAQQRQEGLDIVDQYPYEGRLRMARGGVTALSAFNPLATGPVSEINQIMDSSDPHKTARATGSGIFNIMTLLVPEAVEKLGVPISPEMRANRLKFAAGESREMMHNLPEVIPEIEKTVNSSGVVPKKGGDFFKAVADTANRLNGEVDAAIAPIANQHFFPAETIQKLEQYKLKNSRWDVTNPGAVEVIDNAIKKYKNFFSYEDARGVVKDMRKELSPLRKAKTSTAASAILSDAEDAVNKIVSDTMSDALDRGYARTSGKPFEYWQDLRNKQSGIINVRDSLMNRITEAEYKAGAKKGAPALEGVHPHIYIGTDFIPRAHISGWQTILNNSTTLTDIDKAVLRAWTPSPVARTARAVKPVTRGTFAARTIPPSASQKDQQ
jgi:hypothetical protein